MPNRRQNGVEQSRVRTWLFFRVFAIATVLFESFYLNMTK